MANYWVVGATVSEQDMSGDFITRGFWFGDRDDAQDKINQISQGDRIAIKSMLGRGSNEVTIKAVGVVSKVSKVNATAFQFFYVDWIDLRNENRKVPFSGYGGTIHSVKITDDVPKAIFQL